jgi:hypothetical protein
MVLLRLVRALALVPVRLKERPTSLIGMEALAAEQTMSLQAYLPSPKRTTVAA